MKFSTIPQVLLIDSSNLISKLLNNIKPYQPSFNQIYKSNIAHISNKINLSIKNQNSFNSIRQCTQGLYSMIQKDVLQGQLYQLNQASKYYFTAPGKLIRPTLVMSIFQLYKYFNKSQKTFTQIEKQCKLWSGLIQCIHIASLMHDDIIDNSQTRRGKQSHHLKFGYRKTLFSGNYIIARAAKKIYQFSDIGMYKIYSTIIQDLTVGQVFQAQRKSQFSYNQLFLKNIKKSHFKTGSLISNALRGVGQLMYLSQTQNQKLYHLGQYIGIIYQIIDDILDYQGDPQKLGKPILGDLSQGIVNLPAFFPLIQGNIQEKQIINKAMQNKINSKEQCERILELVKKYDGCMKARSLAYSFANELLEQLQKIDVEDRSGIKYFLSKILNREK